MDPSKREVTWAPRYGYSWILVREGGMEGSGVGPLDMGAHGYLAWGP